MQDFRAERHLQIGRITGDQIETRAIPLMFLINFGWDLNPNNKESIVNAPNGSTPLSSTSAPRPEPTFALTNFPPATSSTTKTSAICFGP
jgi:hypothetical protein